MKLATLVLNLLAFTAANLHAQSYTWTTIAGIPPQIGSTDGVPSGARFYNPTGIAADAAGNLYVSDSRNHTIRKVALDGSATTLAGVAGVSGAADGLGSAARFNTPYGLALDAAGNVYVADRFNQVIRKITPAGLVTTYAGAAGVFGSDDGTTQSARFNNPYGLVFDRAGNLFVTDRTTHIVRKISPSGVVTTVAGLAGNSGSTDGAGTAARFLNPAGLAIDSDDNLYVADSGNHTIRKIATDGNVSTLAGSAGLSGTTSGTGAAARFSFPSGLVVDAAGNVLVADTSNDCVRRVTPAGVVTTFAGGADTRGSVNGTGTAARFFNPVAITRTSDGTFYVADTFNNTIRRVTAAAVVSNYSGPGGNFANADGQGTAARFNYAHGMSIDGQSNLFVNDTRNGAVRRVSLEGTVSTFVRLPNSSSYGISTNNFGDMVVPDRTTHTIRIYSTSAPDRFIDVGTSGRAGSDNGNITVATFNGPTAVALDPNFQIINIADTGNHVIRRITISVTGTVTATTFAGTAGSSGATNGTGAAARFSSPQGIAADRGGNVYVADTGSHTIRKITLAGVVTTLAGTAFSSGSANGTGATARFNSPTEIAVDDAGNVFVCDNANHTIRKVTAAGTVTTIGGLALTSGHADGTGTATRFFDPSGIALGSDGAIYVMEASNNTVRKGELDRAPVIIAPPQSLPVIAGSPATFSVGATGGGLSYQWRFNGVAIPGATSPTYTIASASTAVAGRYSVEVNNSADTVTSEAATLSLVNTTNLGRIVNLAIRSQAGTGASTLIVGVGIGGNGTSGNKPVLIRSVGPALTVFGVPGVLSDPKLELYSGSAKVDENDNWGGNAQVAAISSQVGAFALGAATGKDAALYVPALAAGSYTVQMTGSGGSTGVVLAEIYDSTPSASYGPATPRLVNVSARTDVGTGGDILIAGFVIGGATAKTVLIRAVGPTLGLFGVSGTLTDPKLELFSGTTSINQNDNWGGGAALAAAFSSVGAFPLASTSRDAALLVTLAPGSYTAQISGVGNTTGVALVEVYEVP